MFSKAALKAYEDECVRAELFGQPKPDREKFLANHKHLDVEEFEEIEIRTAENTAILDENLKGTSSRIGELNTILASTQTKINKLKGVCGTLTNFLREKLTSTKGNMSYSSDPSYIGQTNYDKDSVPTSSTTQEGCTSQSLGLNDNEMNLKMSPSPHKIRAETSQTKNKNCGDINTALQDLEEMQKDDVTVLKSSVKDIGNTVKSQMSKLDRLIIQTEKAESSIQHQNKQMRSFLR